MQQCPLLTTKNYVPPTQSEVVHQPGLIKQLNDGAYHVLTSISTPVGFGKTSLVRDRIQAMYGASSPIAVTWISQDEGDNDLACFLTYFSKTLNHIEGLVSTVGKSVLSMHPSLQPPPTKTILTSQVNEIEI